MLATLILMYFFFVLGKDKTEDKISIKTFEMKCK